MALREAKEETGLTELRPLWDGIFSIQVLDVDHHVKRGQYVASHLHLDCCYLWQADETAPTRAREAKTPASAGCPSMKCCRSPTSRSWKSFTGS